MALHHLCVSLYLHCHSCSFLLILPGLPYQDLSCGGLHYIQIRDIFIFRPVFHSLDWNILKSSTAASSISRLLGSMSLNSSGNRICLFLMVAGLSAALKLSMFFWAWSGFSFLLYFRTFSTCAPLQHTPDVAQPYNTTISLSLYQPHRELEYQRSTQEENNDRVFPGQLASIADAYVNGAFCTCHQSHANVSGIPALLFNEKCGVGCLVASTVAFLKFASHGPIDKVADEPWLCLSVPHHHVTESIQ